MWWLSVHKYHIFNRRQCLYLGKCYLQIWTDYMNWFQSAYSPVRVWFPIWCYAVHLSLTSKCLTQYLRRISICYPGVSLQLRGLDFFSGRRIWTSAGGRCTWEEVLNNIKMEKRRLSTCVTDLWRTCQAGICLRNTNSFHEKSVQVCRISYIASFA